MANLWAGQAHPLAQEVPAAELVAELALECRRAIAVVSRLLNRDGG